MCKEHACLHAGFPEKNKEGLDSVVNTRTVAGVTRLACTCFSFMNRETGTTPFPCSFDANNLYTMDVKLEFTLFTLFHI